jgi:hypothetical protein
MAAQFNDPITQKMADFLIEIGIDVVSVGDAGVTFLPGIRVENGKILVNEEQLTYPGDLLHEGGHLAIAPAALRPSLTGEVVIPGTDPEPVEAYAIAWSYAAMVHLGLDPKVIFHPGGYRVESERLEANFNLGVYIGVNGLQDAGLSLTQPEALKRGLPPYPHMLKWLRD